MNYQKGYFAAVLSEESTETLKRLAVFPRVFCHHITLAYEPDESVAAKYVEMIGKELTGTVVLIWQDDRTQVAEVMGIVGENRKSHVTISCSKNTPPSRGKKVVENELGSFEMINIPITAVVSFIPHPR